MRFFDRACKLTIRRSTATASELIRETVEITEMRVQFAITKTIGKSPNRCDLTISNLAESARAALEKAPLTVTLQAGHDDVLKTIFVGDLKHGHSEKHGTDWETRLQLIDGGRAIGATRIKKTYQAGTRRRQILSEIAATMGLKLPAALQRNPEFDQSLASSVAFMGSAAEHFSLLLGYHGYGWSVQSGQLQVLRDTETREEGPWLIDASSALVGSPSYDAPEKKGKAPKLTFRCLLFPELVPGGRVSLATRHVRGLHRILEVKHLGDTAGEQWFTDVEARPL